MLHLAPLQTADAPDLLAFEQDNRAFFEAHINARPPAYYAVSGVRAAIADARREAAEDKSYHYLVRDGSGLLVGRVNLTRVKRAHFHSAELGYRVAQSACGRGVASQAVRQVIAIAFHELKLLRIEATSRPENLGSTRVLTGNGFTPFGRSRQSFELAGTWYDLVHYELHAD